MHIIDHSLARPSPAAAASVSGTPRAGWKAPELHIVARNMASFSHGNTTVTGSADRDSVSKEQG